MKTIEERAKEWAYRYPMTPDGYLTESDMRAVATNSYKQGYHDAVEKACELLKAVGVLTDDDSIMGFIKAMGE